MLVEILVHDEQLELRRIEDMSAKTEVSRPWEAKRKGAESEITICDVFIRYGGIDASYQYAKEVFLQYLEVQETKEVFFTVTSEDIVVIKSDCSALGALERTILGVISQKCIEYEQRKAKWLSSRDTSSNTKLKRRKGRSD